MDIYVDFDDCLCETARYFSGLVKRMFDKDIPYEDIQFFDLQNSFNLADDEFDEMMIEAHRPEVLITYEETTNASSIINSWIYEGHNVSIITGRPYSAYEASKEWHINHNLDRVQLYCLNKYGRDSFLKGSSFSLELEDYYKMHFDFVVEDSPSAFKYLTHLKDARIMIFDRPWNKDCKFPSQNFHRCYNWKEIDREFDSTRRG